ncbi:MAG: class II aldolase/adducin family protein [Clostridiales Family XIII bacterium]|jgi:rhamnose utilization protein RhaD (predicted bifunctional aldolase and dehydrogenase)|nr:class II aldolase/adducin family protein [Clostridiales Family XIII bacterium]
MLEKLVELSNRYGARPEYTLAGGGNSSYKNNGEMYVKASGTRLATIESEGFVGVDRHKLAYIMQKEYSADEKQREAEVLADLMEARLPGSETKRPSVETLLHNLFTEAYVLHLHPAAVNGLSCGRGGEMAAREIFADEFVWVESYKPGYALAKLCEKKISDYRSVHGKNPNKIILQNHGIFAAGDEPEIIDRIMEDLMRKLHTAMPLKPRHEAVFAESLQRIQEFKRIIKETTGCGAVVHLTNPDMMEMIEDEGSFFPLSAPFTPDHIVYCKARFLRIDADEPTKPGELAEPGESTESGELIKQEELIQRKCAEFTREFGYAPKVICVKGLGAFLTGINETDAADTAALFADAVDIAVYSRNFGGALHMTPELVKFISGWEAEAYRRKVADG